MPTASMQREEDRTHVKSNGVTMTMGTIDRMEVRRGEESGME
jgi:hypothetical protein